MRQLNAPSTRTTSERTLAAVVAIVHMEGNHILRKPEPVVEEADRRIAVAARNSPAKMRPASCHLLVRGQGRFPLASGSWIEGMRLSSRSATMLPTDLKGLPIRLDLIPKYSV